MNSEFHANKRVIWLDLYRTGRTKEYPLPEMFSYEQMVSNFFRSYNTRADRHSSLYSFARTATTSLASSWDSLLDVRAPLLESMQLALTSKDDTLIVKLERFEDCREWG
mmetsp:Transcript_40833/g.74763  ORF Transcript_40833/g.74763 Transcript_40833/m.74763 type:complete len:109 (+) Transcript_40833:480-806(+)